MRFPSFLTLLLTIFLSFSGVHAQSTQKAKDPAPAASTLTAAAALLNDVYKADFAAAKTPELKTALARKLLDGAREERDAGGRYVLLTKARDLAIDAGDVDACAAAIDQLDASFVMDAAKARSDAYIALARNVRFYADQQRLAEDISAAVQSALAVDRFDAAKTLAEAGLSNAQKMSDAEITQLAAADLRAARDAEAAYLDVKKALATLATTPNDPEANLKAGKYRCFIKGDWKTGLPLLALGTDPTLKALAEKEAASPATAPADEAIKLADAWWDAADKLPPAARIAAQAHAAFWYQQALPSMTGLQKTKLEQRVAKSKTDMDAAHPTAAGRIDLLKLVDVARDTVKGRWELHDGALCSDDTDMGRVQILYQPPAEYDFCVVFTRTAGNDCMAQVCPALDHQFALILGGWENTVAAFELVAGNRSSGNATTRRAKDLLANGRRYLSVVKVRKDRVQAYVDGKLILEWKTNYSDMSLPDYLQLPRNDTLGVASCRSPITFHSIEIREITGKGTLLTPPTENK